ncbi:MAG: carbohydrate-binding domain-containing protein [Desulfotomaculaceae bacterium]|nr:carbohydrate-binding domain-containing protein [Desulfotomaculaceae bacterium]
MPNKNQKFVALLVAALVAITGFTGCSSDTGAATNTAGANGTSTEIAAIAVEYSSEDLDSTWDPATATTITLQGSSIEVAGSGAASEGSKLTITAAGTYVLGGTLTDGQIVVDAKKDDLVRLVLNGASISCSDNAAIYAKQAKKTILTLAEGSSNTVQDGTAYTLAEGEDEPDAAIFSQDDLTINGTGSLTLRGQFKHGIATKDDLVITGGGINVIAAGDGLRGRDSIAVNGGAITVEAGGDGLQANNDEAADKGWISLDSGVFNIIAGNDGIQAETLLQVTNGKVSLTTGGGSVNASTDLSGAPRSEWGKRETAAIATSAEEDTVSAKGLKAGAGILISGGVIAIDSSDDALHSNGEILIKAGELEIASGDDGIHADSALTVDGGAILITQSYEGLESASISINSGTVRLTAKDDGFNAAGGNDGSSQGGRPGENSFKSDSPYFIRITGGYIAIDAGGDGIDSNGALYFNGGTVLVSGPTNNGNGPMDYNGECEVTGGTLAIAGSSGMAQAPGEASSQNSITVYYTKTQEAGTLVTLTDESGKTILAFAPAKTYQSIVLSTPELEQGKTYTLSSGGTCSGQLSDGLYTGGACSGGTKLTDVTISGTVTRIADDGSEVSGGMGSMGGQGGPGGRQATTNNQAPPDNLMPSDNKQPPTR